MTLYHNPWVHATILRVIPPHTMQVSMPLVELIGTASLEMSLFGKRGNWPFRPPLLARKHSRPALCFEKYEAVRTATRLRATPSPLGREKKQRTLTGKLACDVAGEQRYVRPMKPQQQTATQRVPNEVV